MRKEATVKINAVCPGCYSNAGHSVVMQEENGVYKCPKDPRHKYKRSEDGMLERTESW